MQKEQKTYTKEFKVEAVRLLESSQKSQAQIARELGVADSTLSQWRKDLAEHGHDAFPGSGHQPPLKEENRHLKREVEVLRQEREILKKAISIFSRGQGCAYQFVAEHQHAYPITRMCEVLEVSVSGYYAWCKRPVSTHQREDARLAAEIQTIFLENRQVYGSPRIHAVLHTRGVRCGRKRVARLMQALGLCAKPHQRRKPMTTSSDPTAHFAPNTLGRDFTAERPNTKWVTDITAIPTAEGWLYLAVVLDLFSRMVVGWAMAPTEDEQLVTLAFQMALARRHPPAGLLHHSDRGREYTSQGYRTLLAEQGIQVSMSRTANCYDNAAMESFFDTLKSECVKRTQFHTYAQARSVIFEYLECWYNPVRLHSTLRYVSPLVYEQAFAPSVR